MLYPDDYVTSVYTVDFVRLFADGYRSIIFDIDNTLVPHGAPADERAVGFFAELKAIGFRTLLLSNNDKQRVRSFSEAVGADAYIFKAGKPNVSGYEQALQTLGTKAQQTLFVGDQIFTDILGANRAGIRTIMVEPILKWREEIQIICKRFLEAPVLMRYRRHVKRNGIAAPVPRKGAQTDDIENRENP